MKPKKNPKVDLTRNSNIYFAVGLCLALFVSWRVAEIKTHKKSDFRPNQNAIFIEEESIPITIEQLKKPEPPPRDPVDFDIKDDDASDDEDFFKPTEITTNDIIDDVPTLDPPLDPIEVPYILVQDSPLFPGCEYVKKSERRKCFQEKIQRHIARNFRYPEIAQEMGIQGRVYVQFIISKDGSITGIRTRGPDKNLEKEANRIISKLPTMTPGKQRGRPVRVPFSIPITFRLQ